MKTPDVYDNERKFIFTNWSSEEFVGRWAESMTTIRPGESIELPMYKAYNFCKHFVDREMNRDPSLQSFVNVEEKREPFEVKTIVEIGQGTDSPALQALKEKIRAEIELANSVSGNEEKPMEIAQEGEFAELNEEIVETSTKSKVAAKKSK